MLYDIYLRTRCFTEPSLQDLLPRLAVLGKPEIQQKLAPFSQEDLKSRGSLRPPGFLGLDVEEDLARELYGRLAAVKGSGEVLSGAYREPKITQEQALKIAELELGCFCQQHYPGYQFEPVRLYRSEVRWWAFVTFSHQWQQEQQGLILGSGGPIACVDKLDGHLWRW